MNLKKTLLEHRRSKTTEIYAYITKRGMKKIINPLENLDIENED